MKMTKVLEGKLKDVVNYLNGQSETEEEQDKQYILEKHNGLRIIYEKQRPNNTKSREEIRDRIYGPKM